MKPIFYEVSEKFVNMKSDVKFAAIVILKCESIVKVSSDFLQAISIA